ncbi:MAG: hypothetical protein AB7I27_12060 [Bacteriovoracaceae bacterium]
MKKSIGILFLATLMSCEGDKTQNKSTATPAPTHNGQQVYTTETEKLSTVKINVSRKVKLADDLGNIEDFKRHINEYVVSFEAESGHLYDGKVICSKNDFDRTNFKIQSYFDDQGQKAELELKISETDPSNVQYRCSLESSGQILETHNIQLKKSFIVDNETGLISTLGTEPIAALVIEKNGVLITDGLDVDLQIDEFVSNNGKIVTFPVNRVTETPPNQNGRSGGVISLNIKKAYGTATFELRGMNGGKQTAVPPKIEIAPKADSALDGKCQNGKKYDERDTFCNGKQGYRGFKGHKGFSGFSGGDSGSLNLKVSNPINLNLSVLYFPGLGEIGGIGGEGGPGGPGGQGSNVTWIEREEGGGPGGCIRCLYRMPQGSIEHSLKFRNGPQGIKGEQGEAGGPGVIGAKLTSTLIFNNSNLKFEITDNWKNY